MTWQILAIASTFGSAIALLLQRRFFQKHDVGIVDYAIFFQIFTGFVLFLYALVRGLDTSVNTLPALNILYMGLLFSFGSVMMFRAIATIHVSQFSILFSSRALWSVVAAFFVFGEVLTAVQILGATLVIAAIIIASYQKDFSSQNKGQLYALLAAIAFGVAFVNDTYILKDGFDVPTFLSFAFIIPGLILSVIYPKAGRAAAKMLFSPKILLWATPISGFYAFGAITIFLAFQEAYNAAVLASIAQLQTILIVLGGIIFLKEKTNITRKIVAGMISVVGVILLTI